MKKIDRFRRMGKASFYNGNSHSQLAVPRNVFLWWLGWKDAYSATRYRALMREPKPDVTALKLLDMFYAIARGGVARQLQDSTYLDLMDSPEDLLPDTPACRGVPDMNDDWEPAQ